jgi:hypothetical protein
MPFPNVIDAPFFRRVFAPWNCLAIILTIVSHTFMIKGNKTSPMKINLHCDFGIKKDNSPAEDAHNS